jgi:hypothetical protein
MIPEEYQPLDGDTIPTAHASEAVIAQHAAAALAYLRRVGALDVAEMLGLGGAA